MGYWEILFVPITDTTARPTRSESLAKCPSWSSHHLSLDLIIHEHLKSFQFIKELSSYSHAGNMKNMVRHGFINVSSCDSPGAVLAGLVGLEVFTSLGCYNSLFWIKLINSFMCIQCRLRVAHFCLLFWPTIKAHLVTVFFKDNIFFNMILY